MLFCRLFNAPMKCGEEKLDYKRLKKTKLRRERCKNNGDLTRKLKVSSTKVFYFFTIKIMNVKGLNPGVISKG